MSKIKGNIKGGVLTTEINIGKRSIDKGIGTVAERFGFAKRIDWNKIAAKALAEKTDEDFDDILASSQKFKYIPFVHGWVKYKGKDYFGSLNFEESAKRGKPIIDLAYCATKALNNVWEMQRVWNKNFEIVK